MNQQVAFDCVLVFFFGFSSAKKPSKNNFPPRRVALSRNDSRIYFYQPGDNNKLSVGLSIECSCGSSGEVCQKLSTTNFCRRLFPFLVKKKVGKLLPEVKIETGQDSFTSALANFSRRESSAESDLIVASRDALRATRFD